MKSKKVSICIPVYGSEPYLESCLQSVKNQTFTDYEVIVVNDGSTGFDKDGNDCKKIIKKVKKTLKLKINYIEHSENKGLLEARRTAIYAAKGDYIFNLDSDDRIPPEALEILYKKAVETDADIVHGSASLFNANGAEEKVHGNEEAEEKIRQDKIRKITNVYIGTLENENILDNYLSLQGHCGFLWGKLYKRELYLESFNSIPPMFCTMAEDVIQYFWLTYYAKKYVGINDCVYNYCHDTGVTSSIVIKDLKKWEQVCSVASVFTAIYTSLEEQNIEINKNLREKISVQCCNYVANNLMQLKQAVIPELQAQAREILNDYWGPDFVAKIECKLNGTRA